MAASLITKLLPFLAWRRRVTAATLRDDALAGLVGALVVLPQGVAYAALAGLPVEYGLYTAMLPVAIAALWGSSWHQVSGPTNTISLAVFATLAPLAAPGSADYIRLALTLALLVGIVQLAMGAARLGWLVNFISHTVIVGFTAGAGLLIIAAQLHTFFGIDVPSSAEFGRNAARFARNAAGLDPWTTATGLVTVLAAIVARRAVRRVPYMIVALVVGSGFGWLATQWGGHIRMVGALPGGLPPPSMPSFDHAQWQALAPAVLALTALALAQAVSVARAVALRTGQRLDSNQEFIGQGLSNIAAAFTSGYLSSGSFNRIWVNYESGARTPIAAVLSAAFLAAIVVAVAPLGAHLPLAVMAGLLFFVAWGLIDFRDMKRIARASRGEALVLVVTVAATLALQIAFAIFVGVLASLFVYLHRTTHPRVTRLAIDPQSRRLAALDASSPGDRDVEIVRLDGSLFFGAIEHVRDELEAIRLARHHAPDMLLVASGVNFIDVAGAEMLAEEARLARRAGGALYFCEVKPAVLDLLERGGFIDAIGRERVFETSEAALDAIASGGTGRRPAQERDADRIAESPHGTSDFP